MNCTGIQGARKCPVTELKWEPWAESSFNHMNRYPECLEEMKPVEMTLFTTNMSDCKLTPGTDETDTGYFFSFPACANAKNLTGVNKYVFMIHGFESDIEEWSNEAKDELLIAEPADTIGIVIVNWEEGAKHDIFG